MAGYCYIGIIVLTIPLYVRCSTNGTQPSAMCGRYQLQLEGTQLSNVHGAAQWRAGHDTQYTPRNAVRPTTYAPVIVNDGDGPEIMMMKVKSQLASRLLLFLCTKLSMRLLTFL